MVLRASSPSPHPPLVLSLSSSWTLRPTRPTLFPYTTLFRSPTAQPSRGRSESGSDIDLRPPHCPRRSARPRRARAGRPLPGRSRSEEHTSELQSREKLVCRLLLEKKKARRLDGHCPRGIDGR